MENLVTYQMKKLFIPISSNFFTVTLYKQIDIKNAQGTSSKVAKIFKVSMNGPSWDSRNVLKNKNANVGSL